MNHPLKEYKLSADATSLYKKLFPFSMYLLLAIFYGLCVLAMYQVGEFDIWFLLVPIMMVGIAYFFLQDGMIGLVDDVFDCGEYLLMRDRGTESHIKLSDVVEFEYSYLSNPPMIYVKYRKFGNSYKAFKFSPPHTQGSPNLEIIDLINRIDEAKE